MEKIELSRRGFARSLLGGAALALAGCAGLNTAQLLDDLETACALIPIGTTFFISFTSSIPLLVNVNPIVQQIGTTAENDCNALVTAVKNAIAAINGQGGDATVQITTSSSNPAALRAGRSLARKVEEVYPAARDLPAGVRTVKFFVPHHIF